jgi:hypothetical protein
MFFVGEVVFLVAHRGDSMGYGFRIDLPELIPQFLEGHSGANSVLKANP